MGIFSENTENVLRNTVIRLAKRQELAGETFQAPLHDPRSRRRLPASQNWIFWILYPFLTDFARFEILAM